MKSLLTNYRFPLLFLALFVLFQWIFYRLPDIWVQQVWVVNFAVQPSAFFLNLFDSSLNVTTEGTRLVSNVARLNVLKGCEGTEAVLMLCAAIIAALQPWRFTLIGLLIGSALIFVLNQLRIISLFYIAGYQRAWFEPVHGYIAPLIIVGLLALFFMGWLHVVKSQRKTA